MGDRRPAKPELTPEEGRRALRDHVIERASIARARHGVPVDLESMRAILEDREAVRYPTTVVFDASKLEPGEFAHAEQAGERPADGFVLRVHPRYRDRPGDLPLLVAYHLVRVNYGEIATSEEAELFGATLLGLAVDDYYGRVCRLADELARGPSGRLEG